MNPLPARFLRSLERTDLPAAVILGVGVCGLAVARALSRQRVPVLGVHTSRPRPAASSSAWDIAVLPGLNGEDAPAALLALGERLGKRAKPVLIATHDVYVELLSHSAGALSAVYRFEVPEPAALAVLRDKARFADEARRRGWEIPRTILVSDPADLAHAARELGFPLILKPAWGGLPFRSNAPVKAGICRSRPELDRLYAEFSRWEREQLAQEFIAGGDADLFFSLHYHTAGLRELGRFTGRKLRQWPPLCGNTSLAAAHPDPELAARAAALLQTMKCVGFGGVEYKRDPRNGRCYVIEPTAGRPDLQIGLALGNGVDLAARAYSHLTGVALPERPPPRRARRWLNFHEDVRSAIHARRNRELTLPGYFRSLRGPRLFAFWHPMDFRIYPALVRGFLAFLLGATRSRWRRLRRR